MANLNSKFQEFNKNISLSESRKENLKNSKDALQNKVIRYFQDNTNLSVPSFFIQGSYKMGTMILKKDNTYDVDLGVYFDNNEGLTGESLQKKVLEAVTNHTTGGAQHRQNCIRVIYSGEYNIDLPVFYKNYFGAYNLASKNMDKLDDTRQMVEWFENKKDRNGQLVRLVKYMKAWADFRTHKMPSGIMLTIWLAEHFISNDRDDLALLQTLEHTKHCIAMNGRRCLNPINQSEDLANKLTLQQKQNFEIELTTLIRALDTAINDPENERAYNSLKPFFGDRF